MLLGRKLGNIKKIFSLIFLTFMLSLVFAKSTIAMVPEGIAVLPMDFPTEGSSYSIYPKTIRLLSDDIVNQLELKTDYKILDVTTSEKLIDEAGFRSEYINLIRNYKNNYTVNYDKCEKLASILGVDKILFIAGGFDTQNVEIKRSKLYILAMPDFNNATPTYSFNSHMILLDVAERTVLWEKGFTEKFNADNFGVPSQYFAENASAVSKIKEVSTKLSSKATSYILETINTPYLRVNGEISLPESDTVYKEITKDGYLAKDRPFKNISNIIENKAEKYKNWAIKKLD